MFAPFSSPRRADDPTVAGVARPLLSVLALPLVAALGSCAHAPELNPRSVPLSALAATFADDSPRFTLEPAVAPHRAPAGEEGAAAASVALNQSLSADSTHATLTFTVPDPEADLTVTLDPHRADQAPQSASHRVRGPVATLEVPLLSPRVDVTLSFTTAGGAVPDIRHATLRYDRTPADFSPTGVPALTPAATGLDYPRDRSETIGRDAEVQGVAHDAGHWYIANQKYVARIPLGADLNALPEHLPRFNIPADLAPRWNHIGDLDAFGGRLYVPLEGPRPLLLVVDPASMTEQARYEVTPRGDTAEIPWAAVNPLDGTVAASTFHLSEAPLRHVRVYFVTPDTGAGSRLQLNHTFALADARGSTAGVRVDAAQGAAFSRQGHFYVVSDADDHGNPACASPWADAIHLGCHGLYAFGGEEPPSAGLRNGYGVPTRIRRFLSFTPIERQSRPIGLPIVGTVNLSQELEGLDIFELPPGVSPGISGMIHILMSHADRGLQHSFWFKHYDVASPAARWWF